MANFDAGTWGAMGGEGGGFIGTNYGVPSDMFGLSPDDLEGLPSSVLEELMGMIWSFLEKIDAREKDVIKKFMLESGILEYDTQEGTFQYLTDNSKFGLDRNEGQIIHNLRALAGL